MTTKILIIRFSSIGDIVLTTPVIRCLKKQIEGDVVIHYITKKSFVSLLEANPYLDKIYGIEKSVSEVKQALKEEQYDYVIDLHRNFRSGRVKKAISALSFSFDKINWEKWLIVNLKINKLPSKHIVERYLETCAPLGITNDKKGLDYFIPPKEEVAITTLPIEFQNGYIGFVIGGSYETKKMSVSKIIAVCKQLNTPIVLLGGKEDAENAQLIAKTVGTTIFNACGKFNLNQSASLVKQASKIITHDTGLMHIAAAFNKDIISVWGNTIPEFGMGPYLPSVSSKIIEVKNLNCRPCSKLGFKKCPKKHFKCMELINEKEFE